MSTDTLRRRGPSPPAAVNYLELTFGLFGGAAAWLLRLIANASLVGYSCLVGATWPVWAATGVFAAVAVASFVVAWRYHRIGQAADAEGARWLALLGLALNTLAVAGILLETAPVLWLDICRAVRVP